MAHVAELREEEEDRRKATDWFQKQIERVDSVQATLRSSLASEPSQQPEVGDLKGVWDLYDLDVRPKTLWPTGEDYHLEFVQAAAPREILPITESEAAEGGSSIAWYLKDNSGDIVPFQIPELASLKPIPILL